MKETIILIYFVLSSGVMLSAQVPAFPGAEGGGACSIGGRGGKVYYVNSLEDSNTGSLNEGTLRWCLAQEGAKTILFNVAGIIHLKSALFISSNTTIAGQTAPGSGICIADNTVKIKGDNIIVRFLRFRMGDLYGVEEDSFQGFGYKNIIIDHCSMSWSTDECASFYDNENFTLQWSILSESLTSSVHRKGNHGYGAIWGGRTASFHHNLLAHHDSRNPRMCGSRYSNKADLELVDFRNNVIYNWGANSGYAGEGGRYNFVNNYYKPTNSSTHKGRIFSPNADDGTNRQAKGVWGTFYVSGNYIEGNERVSKNNIEGIEPYPNTKNVSEIISNTEFPTPQILTHSAYEAYELVLDRAGASLYRDETDYRIITETQEGLTPQRASGNKNTKAGMIDSQQDVGGWEEYDFCTCQVPKDSDSDGIPDGWLEANYPNKKANDVNEDGYTYLEVFLNSLVEHLIK